MGTGYTRNDTPNNIADGNVINASDLDGEFDSIQAAFNASTGHSHDGTTGEGPQIDTGGIANDAVTLGTKTSGNYVATGAVSGVGLSGSASAEGATFTITSNATSANTGSTIVARDASGNFSAGTITAALTGTASNAALLDSIDSTSFLRSDAADTKTSGDLSFSDNVKAIFGAGSDLQIYHTGSTSYIYEQGTGDLRIRGSQVRIEDDDGSTLALFKEDAGVELRYDGAVKLESTATGVDVTGTVTMDGGSTSADFSFGDNDKAIFGAGSDLQIYHDGGNSRIAEVGNGRLTLETNGDSIRLTKGTTENMLIATPDGSVDLYHNNLPKLVTTATGVDVTGVITTDGMTTSADINFGDNDKAVFGAGSDLQIYHNGSDSVVRDAGTGDLLLAGSTNVKITTSGFGETMAAFTTNGAATLYYDNAAKLATTATGVDVTGTVTVDGLTVDGGTITAGASGTSGQIDAPESFVINIDSDNNSTTRAFVIKNNGSAEIARFTEGGNVGIGTSSPARALDISSGHLRLSDNYNVEWGGGTNYVRGSSASNYLLFTTNGTERMRIDSSGNVDITGDTAITGHASIGVDAIASTRALTVAGATDGSGSTILQLYNSSLASKFSVRDDGYIFASRGAVGTLATFTDGVATNFTFRTDGSNVGTFGTEAGSTQLAFMVANSEKMRIDGSGNLYVGKTSDSATATGITVGSAGFIRAVRNETVGVFNRQGSDGNLLSFFRSNAGVGAIDVTTSGTTYGTTSDIRLKTDIEPLVATDKLMAMNPVSYAWKVDPDGPRSMGFIAQEMQEVMPEAVSTGDDEDAMMSMDYGRITPVLVAALQDAHRKIEDLESRLAAMENN